MGDAKKDLIYVLLLLLAVALIWFFSGGPSRSSSEDEPFLRSPIEKSSEQILAPIK